jgi:hypothetical protein
MSGVRIAQMLIFALVGGFLVWVLIDQAEGWADAVVIAGIVLTAWGVFVAYNHRRYPPATEKRRIVRGPDSRW